MNFTQYLKPYGEKRYVSVDRPDEIESMAITVRNSGCRFETEILTTGEVSMDCVDEDGELVAGPLICTNGPATLTNVDALVRQAHAVIVQEPIRETIDREEDRR